MISTNEPPSRPSEAIFTSESSGSARSSGTVKVAFASKLAGSSSSPVTEPTVMPASRTSVPTRDPLGAAEARGQRVAVAGELHAAGLAGVDHEADRRGEHHRADHGLRDAVRHPAPLLRRPGLVVRRRLRAGRRGCCPAAGRRARCRSGSARAASPRACAAAAPPSAAPGRCGAASRATPAPPGSPRPRRCRSPSAARRPPTGSRCCPRRPRRRACPCARCRTACRRSGRSTR